MSQAFFCEIISVQMGCSYLVTFGSRQFTSLIKYAILQVLDS